jgi:aldose sugar dehydrogenase
MRRPSSYHHSSVAFVALTSILVVALSSAQQRPVQQAEDPTRVGVRGRVGSGPDTLPDKPQVLGRSGHRLRVTPLKGLERPWALAFLPDGDMLVTERPGRLRIVRRNLTLDPQPIAGVPSVLASAYKGLMDVALHPDFAQNRFVYFTYSKLAPGESATVDFDKLTGPAGLAVLARGRYDGGHTLTDVRDIFVSNALTSGVSAARIAFGRDAKIYMSIGAPSYEVGRGGVNRVGIAEEAQDPEKHAGKILRLNDDGTAPTDNPFTGQAGFQPEIYALGIRNALGLIVHATTGEIFEADHGPMGGDEINIIKPGKNYGWPFVSYGRAYTGDPTTHGSGPMLPEPCAPGMEPPFLFWAPNIAPGGMAVYSGDRFPAWKGDLFVGGLAGTGLYRVDLNERGLPGSREPLLTELRQRIRDVRQGPDGFLYLLTDHDAGALIRVEPVAETATP